MEFMQALGKYMPPEAITWDWSGAAKSFVEGRAGLYIGAGEWFSMCDDPAQSRSGRARGSGPISNGTGHPASEPVQL
jgi:hypothetical protein